MSLEQKLEENTAAILKLTEAIANMGSVPAAKKTAKKAAKKAAKEEPKEEPVEEPKEEPKAEETKEEPKAEEPEEATHQMIREHVKGLLTEADPADRGEIKAKFAAILKDYNVTSLTELIGAKITAVYNKVKAL